MLVAGLHPRPARENGFPCNLLLDWLIHLLSLNKEDYLTPKQGLNLIPKPNPNEPSGPLDPWHLTIFLPLYGLHRFYWNMVESCTFHSSRGVKDWRKGNVYSSSSRNLYLQFSTIVRFKSPTNNLLLSLSFVFFLTSYYISYYNEICISVDKNSERDLRISKCSLRHCLNFTINYVLRRISTTRKSSRKEATE
jgi:hypothetical protein